MDLLQKILNCNEEDIDDIIKQAIEEANLNSNKIERLGFCDNGKTTNSFKGFIPLNTRIKYSNISLEDYGMETTDYMYEFAHYIKKYDIDTKTALVYSLEHFINLYFGIPSNREREEIFNDIAWNTTSTDEEYFEAIKNNKIGDLKNKGVAQCTERAALAQELLSLFDFESYYCIGCIDLGKYQEAHCFNIVKRKSDYAILDYSCTVASYNYHGNVKGYYPYIGVLSEEEFAKFINGGEIMSFQNYEFVEGKRNEIDGKRSYVIGEFEIKREEKDNELE